MREILFRGKRVDNGEWVEGYYLVDRYHGRENLIVYQKALDPFSIYSDKCDPETICQYTGICDSNNNKVFENDIIEAYGFRGRIQYGCYHDYTGLPGTKHMGFYVEWPEDCQIRRGLGHWIGMGCEVIGNAFDNPELLQEV